MPKVYWMVALIMILPLVSCSDHKVTSQTPENCGMLIKYVRSYFENYKDSEEHIHIVRGHYSEHKSDLPACLKEIGELSPPAGGAKWVAPRNGEYHYILFLCNLHDDGFEGASAILDNFTAGPRGGQDSTKSLLEYIKAKKQGEESGLEEVFGRIGKEFQYDHESDIFATYKVPD
ncbi:hypothetical protein OAU50_04515 [Planctomycetota bacterium]|nr:hypothetical protein [Planctomycetota bacterium]